MQNTYLLSIDQGTTGSTALILSLTSGQQLSVIGRKTIDFKQYYPKPGWVEHDLEEVFKSVAEAVASASYDAKNRDAQFDAKKIAGIGISNQRETLCLFEKGTGRPARKAIVWQCRRSTEICEELKNRGLTETVREKTGLVLDPYFTGSKLLWVMRNEPELAKKILSGEVLIGNIDTYLLYRLTGASSYAAEPSNLSRTMLFDITRRDYDQDLLDLFGIAKAKAHLPRILDSAALFGRTKALSFLPDGIPISGILGDQQAALCGQTCFERGDVKCTYGTGAFILVNSGAHRVASRNGMLTTVAWSLDDKLTYALEGAAFVAGAAVQFVRDQLHLLKTSSESEALARDAVAAPGIYFVPALAGLSAPYWNPRARGGIMGLTRGTTDAQVVRAALEGIVFQVDDLIGCMGADLGQKLERMRVDGGAAANDLLMQLQADISEIIVDRPQNLESTALGAGLFAGLGAGIFSSLDDLKKVRVAQKEFFPLKTFASQRSQWVKGWKRAVRAVEEFAKES